MDIVEISIETYGVCVFEQFYLKKKKLPVDGSFRSVIASTISNAISQTFSA